MGSHSLGLEIYLKFMIFEKVTGFLDTPKVQPHVSVDLFMMRGRL